MTTIQSVTVEQIERFRGTAEAAGNAELVSLCDIAARKLRWDVYDRPTPNGWGRALAECVAAINAAGAP